MNKSDEFKTASQSKALLSEGQAVRHQAVAVAGGVLRITSEQLFSGANEIEIDHNGTQYRLRKTSLGKLILTK